MRELSDINALPQDSLSCLFETVNVNLVVAQKSDHKAPWLLRGVEGMASFYIVVKGRCRLRLDGFEEIHQLETGDMAVLLNGRGHWLHNDQPKDALEIEDYQHTTIVRGRFAWERNDLSSLLPDLPAVVHFKNENGRMISWMSRIIRMISDETAADRPGARAIINQMAYIIFVQSVRAGLAEAPVSENRRTECNNTRQIGKALYLLRNQLDESWSLPLLARKCGMSRSALAECFKRATGKSPMTYLMECRMKRACILLRHSPLRIKQISAIVGYGSQPAFSNAFRRWSGFAPGGYRRKR